MLDILLKMDILKIFRMQEPVSKELLTKNSELGQFKEVVMEKDVLLKNHKARIKELETELSELKLKYTQMESMIKISNMDENEYHTVMMSYDDCFKKIWNERQNMIDENTVLKTHLENLEGAYSDLLEKYGKAKIVIDGLMENQDILKKELDDYEKIIDDLEKKYGSLKNYSESKIAEANIEIINKEKENIQEVAKLKVKILQSQAKINELEKHVKFEDICTRQSMFAPLKNNIAKN